MAAKDRRKTPAVKAPLPPPPPLVDDFGKEVVNWLFPAYVTLIVISVFAFVTRATVAQGHEMPLDRAVMTAVNAATLTGLPQPIRADWFKPFGQVLILLLTLAGSLFSLIAGGFAVRRILRLAYSDRQVLIAVAVVEVAALLLGGLGLCGTDTGVLGGLTQGAAAFGNSAFALGHPYDLHAWQTHLIVLPLAFLGGLGITVLLEFYGLFTRGRSLSTHARTALATSLGLYVVGLLLFEFLRWMNGDIAPTVSSFTGVIASSSAASITSRTSGFPFEMTHVWPRAMQWAVIPFMVIGASPGGTGGGVKTTTFAAIFGGGRKSLRGQVAGRAFGIALAWLALYLVVALVGAVMLIFVEPQTGADRLVFVSFSALSNVGLAPDVLSLTAKGNYIVAALMLAGRMVPLLILWWMVDTTNDAELAVG